MLLINAVTFSVHEVLSLDVTNLFSPTATHKPFPKPSKPYATPDPTAKGLAIVPVHVIPFVDFIIPNRCAATQTPLPYATDKHGLTLIFDVFVANNVSLREYLITDKLREEVSPPNKNRIGKESPAVEVVIFTLFATVTPFTIRLE